MKNNIANFTASYGQFKKPSRSVKKRGRKKSKSFQCVEKANFGFDCQGESESDGFEFTRPVVRDGACVDFMSVPIFNEHARSRVAFIDWVNFTFSNEYRSIDSGMDVLSERLKKVFGYGVTKKRSRGLNFYKHSYVLGAGCGFVCVGGQNNTIMVSINAQGCDAARRGWEKRLYRWVTAELFRFRITRIDLAHDFFSGQYTVDDAVKDYDGGLFCFGACVPKIEQIGNWRLPDNPNGRTVYIGSRVAGKLLRVYEKGKQLGQQDSPWVRVECEWRSTKRVIPDEILVKPGQYLAGAYPALFFLSRTQNRIKTMNSKEKILYDKAVEIAKRQVGGLILLMSQFEPSAEEIVKKLVGDKVPERLVVPHWQGSRFIKCE